jgi:hypothetical protein
MANMSYCRFENTLQDLEDCLGVLDEDCDDDKSLEEFENSLGSDYERRAFKRLLTVAEELLMIADRMANAENEA